MESNFSPPASEGQDMMPLAVDYDVDMDLDQPWGNSSNAHSGDELSLQQLSFSDPAQFAQWNPQPLPPIVNGDGCQPDDNFDVSFLVGDHLEFDQLMSSAVQECFPLEPFQSENLSAFDHQVVWPQFVPLPLTGVSNENLFPGLQGTMGQFQAGPQDAIVWDILQQPLERAPETMITDQAVPLGGQPDFLAAFAQDCSISNEMPGLHSLLTDSHMVNHPIEPHEGVQLDIAQIQNQGHDMRTAQTSRPSTRPNPGLSPHPHDVWEAVRPVFYDLHVTQDLTLQQSRMVLELVYYFRATEDAFKKRKERHWPECRKKAQKRGRPKKVMANHVSPPRYVIEQVLPPMPRSMAPQLYKIQTILLLSIDKYIKGFYDSTSIGDETEASYFRAQTDWQLLRDRCLAVSVLTRKNKAFTRQERKAQLSQSRRRERVKAVISGMLHDNVFGKLQNSAKGCNPSQLSFIWSICRSLEGLSPQLGISKPVDNLHIEQFIQSVKGPLNGSRVGHRVGMASLLGVLLEVSPFDLQDTMRISCLCTARALSSRLGPSHPIVLECWANYCRYWDPASLDKPVFFKHYQQALEDSERRYGECDDRTIDVLQNYACSAYYICHDQMQSRLLANELWRRTESICGEIDARSAWTVKVQGMAEAAKMLALLTCINHENKQKSNEEMKKLRRKLNLAGRWAREARRRFREAEEPPPCHTDAKVAISYLEKAVESLVSGDWDCKFFAAGLLDDLANLTWKFCARDESGKNEASRGYRTQAEKIRLTIVSLSKSVEQGQP